MFESLTEKFQSVFRTLRGEGTLNEENSREALRQIRLALLEDFRAPLQMSFKGSLLEIRNSLVEGIGNVLSSLTTVSGAILEYGLPIGFWCFLLFWPGRRAWQRFRARPAVAQ